MSELAIRNARIVLPDGEVTGSLLVRDGVIAAIDSGPSAVGEDFGGDLLLPGLVELHTDHYESHYRPRPAVTLDAVAALLAHDAQVAAAGMTTVFDAVRIGSDPDTGDITADVEKQVDAIAHGEAAGLLRAQHFVHLRCELPTPDVLAQFEAHYRKPIVRLASVMDHTPGERQYTTLEHFVVYYKTKFRFSDAEMAAFIADRQTGRQLYSDANRAAILERGKAAGLAFASHDDATPAHVAEAVDNGVVIAEFPTTLEAARAAHEAGLAVLMGAPNVVRGGSHNGNVAASALAGAGWLDVLSSDYVPFALLQSALILPTVAEGVSLSDAVNFVSRNPARAAGLDDRGAIALGLRADLVRVQPVGTLPVVRAVWRAGRRIS